MNISLHLQSNTYQYKTEKTLFKLVSTLSSIDIIKRLSSENRLVSGLKQRRAQFKSEFNTETYKSIVYYKLGIRDYTSKEEIKKKEATALQYAKILKKYKPDNSGGLNELFDYSELVSVIKKVFKKHMTDYGYLLFTGISLNTLKNKYYAKVKADKICIITAKSTLIQKGTTGTVASVYEFASRQFVALKYANDMSFGFFNNIQTEISNLNKIHKLLSIQSIKLEGFQDPIIADFNLPTHNLIGYLCPRYDIDLLDWILDSNAPQTERIMLCKSLMQVYMNINKLGIWHGDIKLENIMLKNNQAIVIDWVGSMFFDDAAAQFTSPVFNTPEYCNIIDLMDLKYLQEERNILLKSDYIETAKSLELFSIAMVIFGILTSKMPFKNIYDPEFDCMMPQTKTGFKIHLLETYDADILYIMKRMLAHLPEDRYLGEEAFKAWQNIDENTGQFRKKIYKLT